MNQVIRAGLPTAARRVAIMQWCSRLTYWWYPEGYHHLSGPSCKHFCRSASAARTAASLTR